MRKRHAAALVVAVVVTAAVVIGYVVTRPSHPQPTTAKKSPAAGLPSRPPVLSPLPPASTAPTPAGVALDLRAATTSPGFTGELAGEVVDTTTGAVLWGRAAGQPLPPASTAKLLTMSAALVALGPDARLTTRTERAGSTVFLVGGGDVTLQRAAQPATAYPRWASLADLAARTAHALAGVGPVTLRLDTTAWTGPEQAVGWSKDYVGEGDITPPSALELDEGRLQPGNGAGARTTDPATVAGATFAALLRHDGVKLRGRVQLGAAPTSATAVASVSSPPVADLVHQALEQSDNDLAEALGRAVAAHVGEPANFTGEAAAVLDTLRRLPVDIDGVVLNDASGLSRADRVTAVALDGLLRTAATGTTLRPLLAGLPIAGMTGTLADRYRTRPASRAAGVLRAKTGTLTGVNTLAGQVVDASGDLLTFAFLAPRAAGPDETEAALDRLAARLSRCGCR